MRKKCFYNKIKQFKARKSHADNKIIEQVSEF
jgi:hypothetical protein